MVFVPRPTRDTGTPRVRLWKRRTTDHLEGNKMTIFTQFIRDEDGAVTIDWVALTAGILLLGIATVYFLFENGVAGALAEINTTLSNAVDNDIDTQFSGF